MPTKDKRPRVKIQNLTTRHVISEFEKAKGFSTNEVELLEIIQQMKDAGFPDPVNTVGQLIAAYYATCEGRVLG